MKDKADYNIDLEVLHGPLEKIDIGAMAASCADRWSNRSLCRVNDCVVRLGVIHGEFHWHSHDTEDELFMVLEGKLLVDVGETTTELGPHQAYVVPRGVLHRTRAPDRTAILMVEKSTVVPTGSARRHGREKG